MSESGIFIFKARAEFPGPQWTDLFYTCIEDEDPSWGVHEKGDMNSVGVSSSQWQLSLLSAARGKLGSGDYAFMALLPARNGFALVGPKRWKCNAFVADMAILAGLTVPVQHETGAFITKKYPPVANEWATGAANILGWEHIGTYSWPEPGFIVGHPDPLYSGHVGIVDYDGEGIGAGRHIVTRQYDFLDGTSGYNRFMGVVEDED